MMCATACIEPFAVDSAFTDEEYLCDAEHAEVWQAGVEDCRGRLDSGCAGRLSMRGQLQGDPLTVTADIKGANFQFARIIGNDTTYFDRVDLSGTAPYFLWTLKVKSIGAPVDAGELVRTLSWSRTRDVNTVGDFTDSVASADMRIGNGKENVDLQALDDLGNLTIEAQYEDEIRGAFGVAFETEDDFVTGCFVAFPTLTRQVTE